MIITDCEIYWLLAFLITIYILTFNGSSSLKISAMEGKKSGISILQSNSLNKPFKSFKDLAVGEYKVERFDLIKTTFGKRVRIKIEDSYMFLPERYTEEMSEETIDELNGASVTMIYSGKDGNNKSRLMLEFNAIGHNEEGAPES